NPANRLGFLFVRKKKAPFAPYKKAVTTRHSRVGLSGIHLDLGLQEPETPAQHGFPLRACGNDKSGAEV
ncbi:hypothetical protein, partial [Vreelandella alkaliphila]|uniref:hypothetical protein n=1 Tax=Vreelandella alkaliphila TaxID=272774 RepID=UPI003FD709EF